MQAEKEKAFELFDEIASSDHELVMMCQDGRLGLKAIIAVHNTTLGPALGGLRMWPYASDREALTDVLRLSQGMTLKNALAGLNFGGGKAVIIGDSRSQKTEALIRRFGKFVHNLGGKYLTAEDMGMSEKDMEWIRMETPYVTGLSTYHNGSGDPSPVTAYGTYMGMKAAARFKLGSDSLKGMRVMIQGAGSVGSELALLLKEEGAKIYIYDVYTDRAEMVAAETGASLVAGDEVYTHPVDILAPCAMGGILNPYTIPQLSCAVIAGAANNQLLEATRDGEALRQRGIAYAPDFAVNAGGVINISFEGENYQKEQALSKTREIYDTVTNIMESAAQKDITPHEAALELAWQRIKSLGNNLHYR